MNTSALKRFAIQARTKIKEGVKEKLTELGFDAEGKPKDRPRLVEGGTLFCGEMRETAFFDLWRALDSDIQERGLKAVHEEAAYTWFNRLMAIFILQKNGLTGDTLSFDNPDIRVPHIVSEARQGRFPRMSEAEELRLMGIIGDATKTYEQFSLLVIAFCHATPVIQRCFGSAVDYTELLLPRDILERDGFLDMLNHSPFITDEDYEATELLGWLYQFYNAERKDEVYRKLGKGQKVEADDIAPATQIFTPNWIVKYMVQNTLGRIYLDNKPSSPLKDTMNYLVAPAEPAQQDAVFRYGELENLTLLDPACGSGHILLEAFDLLYQMYIRAGYQRREAVESIFRHNLTGIDIDTRAKQLASFALLLKACQKDRSFADGKVLPRVLDMPHGVNLYTWRDTAGHLECNLPTGRRATQKEYEEIAEAFKLLEHASLLGSIMQFSLSEGAREYMRTYLRLFSDKMRQGTFKQVRDSFRLLLALTEKYAAVASNPPYMGSSNMNVALSKYVKENYADGKGDMFATFIMLLLRLTKDNGRAAFITMESWMFLSSFYNLRRSIIDNFFISSLSHFGWHIIGIAFGTAMTVLQKAKENGRKGEYSYLTISDIDQNSNVPYVFPKKDNGRYAYVSQQNFKKIPGCPIGYWVSDRMISCFTNNKSIAEICKPAQGLATSDNKRFLRLWFEVSQKRIGFRCENATIAKQSKKKWFPCNKGGEQRKWYGNQLDIIDWEDDGARIKSFPPAVIRNEYCYFKPNVSWNMVCSGLLSFRYFPEGFILNNASNAIPCDDLLGVLGYLNSNCTKIIAEVINPTINLSNGAVGRFPYMVIDDEGYRNKVKDCISISKQDWDAHETSWDFKENEIVRLSREQNTCSVSGQTLTVRERNTCSVSDQTLTVRERNTCSVSGQTLTVRERNTCSVSGQTLTVRERNTCSVSGQTLTVCERNTCSVSGQTLTVRERNTVRSLVESYKSFWESWFMRLHANEEELNRQFIETYDLMGELSPNVPLREVTILQQGEISIEGDEEKICWHEDVLMRQLISYAVGCMMGRYRLDRAGLAIAHPDTTEEETKAYTYRGEEFEIDDDAIIPLMPTDSPFLDNASARFSNFLRIAFGKEQHTENLNFVEQKLGKSVEEYMIKDFWTDHKRMYQNRPVYWLFQSRKGAFRCIAYMHRMNKYTAQQIRDKYLLKHIDYLKQQIAETERRRAELSPTELRRLDKQRKNLADCQEYDDRLHDVAERQIELDLDDGVARNYALFGDVLAKLK